MSNKFYYGQQDYIAQLNAMDDVSAVGVQTALAATGGAGLIGWIRVAVGAVGVTLDKWMGWQPVGLFEFMSAAQIADVRARTALLDVTAAVQAAINTNKNGLPIIAAPGVYRITDALTLYRGTKIVGSNGTVTDYRAIAGATVFKLDTATAGTKLFTVSQAEAESGYVWGLHLSKMTLLGIGTSGTVGLDLLSVASSTFEDLQITNFGEGLRNDGGMMNTFNRINASKCLVAGLRGPGLALSTTQTYNQCSFRESPWGISLESTSSGYSISSTFNDVLIESTTVGGANIHQSCSATFNTPYTENCPDGRATVSGTTFRLHIDGVNLSPYDSTVNFSGGSVAGDNFGLQTSATLIDIGTSRYVGINGLILKRAANGIRCAAGTPNNSVYLTGPQFISVSSLYTNTAGKLCGTFPTTNLSGAITAQSRVNALNVVGSSLLAGSVGFGATEARTAVGQVVQLRIDDSASPNVEFLNSAGARMALLTNTGNLYLPGSIGVNGAAANQGVVTGSRGGNAALASLLTQLASSGLISNTTSN